MFHKLKWWNVIKPSMKAADYALPTTTWIYINDVKHEFIISWSYS